MNPQIAVKASVISHIGNYRENHEDNFLLDDGQHISEGDFALFSRFSGAFKGFVHRTYESQNVCAGIFAVSDGLGGHNGGEVASRMAVECLDSMREYIFDGSDASHIIDHFQDYCNETNTRIALTASENPQWNGMGATLTGILISNEGVHPYNIGDSRTYHFNGEKLTRLTNDHTEEQRLLDMSIITEKERGLVSGGKAITRFLGLDDRNMTMAAEISPVMPIEAKTWFLLCSDGLTDMVSELQIQTLLIEHIHNSDIDGAVEALVHEALKNNGEHPGGVDNVTVMLVEVQSQRKTLATTLKEIASKLLDRME